MPEIRYVCMSDMHLGEEDSLLTDFEDHNGERRVCRKPNKVMTLLVECLRKVTKDSNEKPTLILNGDILDLALSGMNEAAMAFVDFVKSVMPQEKRIFQNKIILLPGNHDHHVWEVVREKLYLKYLKGKTYEKYLDFPWHATHLIEKPSSHDLDKNYSELEPSAFLTELVRVYGGLNDVEIVIAYPNFGIYREEDDKCVIFHHGHFAQSYYHLMSMVKTWLFPDRKQPKEVWDLELENFAWIDFLWSLLGRSGEVGEGIETIYERLPYDIPRKKLIDNLARGLLLEYNVLGRLGFLRKPLVWILNRRITKLIEKEEKSGKNSSEECLKNYMEGPLMRQIKGELSKIPNDVTFVFGHTHKPFLEAGKFDGYHKPVRVFNSGGWVVENIERRHTHGAAIILVDDHLNTVSVRMYTETKDEIELELPESASDEEKEFHKQVSNLIDPGSDPWSGFSKAAFDSVGVIAEGLKKRIFTDK
jgi:hypothetical protein